MSLGTTFRRSHGRSRPSYRWPNVVPTEHERPISPSLSWHGKPAHLHPGSDHVYRVGYFVDWFRWSVKLTMRWVAHQFALYSAYYSRLHPNLSHITTSGQIEITFQVFKDSLPRRLDQGPPWWKLVSMDIESLNQHFLFRLYLHAGGGSRLRPRCHPISKAQRNERSSSITSFCTNTRLPSNIAQTSIE